MKKESIKSLLDKYKEGKTTLDDESVLVENNSYLKSPLQNWLKEKKQKQSKAPENFNENLWLSFKDKTKEKKSTKNVFFIAAASVVLLMGLFLFQSNEKDTLSYNEKQELLNEALSLYQENNTEDDTIIYQDDIVIIYKSK